MGANSICQSIWSFISNNVELLGFVLAIFTACLGQWNVKKAYQDSLKQSMFDRKLDFFVEISDCLSEGLDYQSKNGKWSGKTLLEIKRLRSKSYFIVGKDFYEFFNRFVK